MPITLPKVYATNDLFVSCQIIRGEKEMKTFMKVEKFRRCLIDDYDNWQYFKKGEAPYNDDKFITFGIRKSHYEAFTGEAMIDFPK
jgi:hypothetical protein